MFGLDTWLTHFSDGSTLLVVIVVAVILGLRHASDPDHLAAVTTLVSNGRGGATRLGLTWGLGHATSLVVLGIPIVLWKAYLPPNVEQSAEVTIGLVIMALALWLLVRWRRGAFAHAHDHTASPGPAEAHAVAGVRDRADPRDRRQRRRRGAPARDDPQPRRCAARARALRAFTAVSMALLSTGFGMTLSRPRVQRSFARIAPALGLLSLAFGVWYTLGALTIAPYWF